VRGSQQAFSEILGPIGSLRSPGRVLFDNLVKTRFSGAWCSLGGPGVSAARLRRCFSVYRNRFTRLLWVPRGGGEGLRVTDPHPLKLAFYSSDLRALR
jgi:hypothetical protein